MDKKQKISILSYGLSLALIVFGLIYTGFSLEIITFAVVIIVFSVINLFKSNKRKKLNLVENDELTVLVALKSYRNSWLVTISIIFIFCWLNFLKIWKPSFDQLVTYLLLSMIFSFQISRFILMKRLDSE